MKRLILLVAVIVGVLAVPAGALSYDKTAGAFGPPGSQLLLGTEAVPTAKVGLLCDVVVDVGNNDSIRPGSDITVATGTDSQLFADTESKPGDPGPVTVQMVMGDTVTVTLTFSPEIEYQDLAGFSGSGTVDVGECETPPPTPPVTVSPEVVTRTTVTAATPLAVQPAFTG